ncbi:hypothetical protein NPIL_586201 [Nephila pilipes]|uniref:Uncharacterized protein n=1 Tax=Nephila pilipes TaxID=299642 RepID=A0A8X6I329_NEPPI|nr:hypothetical protein NPIL_586201 [Nephila pilipes]
MTRMRYSVVKVTAVQCISGKTKAYGFCVTADSLPERLQMAAAYASLSVERVILFTFPGTWMLRWTTRLPETQDLNHCDFWLWGFLKDCVYQRRVKEAEQNSSIVRHISLIA